MNYIVLDLEYNQAFDFGGKEKPDAACPFEIIQIGAVKLDERFNYVSSLNLLIKPAIYTRLHPYVEKITGLSINMLENQCRFPEAYGEFLGFIGEKRAVYCVWGANDIKELYKNIEYYGLGEDVDGFNFIDVQAMASKHLNNVHGVCVGLKNAVKGMNIEVSTPFHNALYDAEYTAKIFQKLKTETINISRFTHDNVVKIAKNKQLIDFARLYRNIEKDLGRRLTKQEKRLYRNVYFCGREKKYENKISAGV